MSEVIKREASPVATFRDQTTQMTPQMAAALEGSGVKVGRFVRCLQNAISAAERGNCFSYLRMLSLPNCGSSCSPIFYSTASTPFMPWCLQVRSGPEKWCSCFLIF